MSDYRHWTSDEEKYIQEHWRLQTDGEMAAALDRSEGAVRTKRRELRCSPQKTWTPEELQYLEDHWGTVSIPGIAKKLGRTVNAIKVRVARMGLGGMLNSGDYVTFNQLMRELTDNGQSYSYQMKSWVKNRGMPIHTKRVNACSFRVVYLEEFWEWAEQHRSFIDFSKLEPLALGKEPDWVAEQRRKDYQSFALQRKDPWSPDEDNNLIRLLKQQKYGYAELSEILRRSEGAIVRRCRDLGLKERPVRADPHRKGGSWSDEQHQILADGIRHGDSYSMIGRVIGKSEKALRGKIYFTYLTEDADKVRAMLGDGPWGHGAPEPISEPEPVLEPEKIRPWNGFVHIRCEACHKESTTCLRTPTDTYICKECGHEMPLPKAYRAYTRCECGQKGAYLTNITDWAFDIPCVRCGSPNTVAYNPGRDCYGPVGSTQRRTKPRKKK